MWNIFEENLCIDLSIRFWYSLAPQRTHSVLRTSLEESRSHVGDSSQSTKAQKPSWPASNTHRPQLSPEQSRQPTLRSRSYRSKLTSFQASPWLLAYLFKTVKCSVIFFFFPDINIFGEWSEIFGKSAQTDLARRKRGASDCNSNHKKGFVFSLIRN